MQEISWEFIFQILLLVTLGTLTYYVVVFVKYFQNKPSKLPPQNVKQLQLQAYERLTLFLERIDPPKLLVRVKPNQTQTEAYEQLLVATIEQEYEHNLSQQIYVTAKTWSHVQRAKNAIIHLLRQAAMHSKSNNSQAFREHILRQFIEQTTPSQSALQILREEAQKQFL